MKRALTIAALCLLTAACGKQGELRPAEGKALPPKPTMASETPTPSQLLTPAPEARPERETELLRRSRVREQDPFDLPPAR